MELVGTGLRKDLNSAVAKLVEFGGEGIGVDANFADGRLWRQLSAGEAVHVDLIAARSG